ncbi:MAG: hypothetical protein K0S37_2616, partial [Microbacterium sp.]|nr:hypothetical protein [Microbacterium sp.]
MGKRWRWVIAIAVVVGIIGVAGFFGGRHLIQQSRLAESCTKVQESLETQRDERVSIEAEPAQLVVIGDSYAQAIDTPVVESFPYVVAAGLDMNASVDAYGGSGYVNPGPCGDGNSFV